MEFLVSLLPWTQLVLSILLIIAILLQQSGAGIGGAFGGGSDVGHSTRRGFEKILFRSTIVLAALFAISAFIALII